MGSAFVVFKNCRSAAEFVLKKFIHHAETALTMQPSLIEDFVKGTKLDYALAIRRNRDQLRAIVLALIALAGLRPHRSLPVGPDGRVQFTLPRSIIAMIMLVLRPAESCLRRLILIAAHGLKPPTPATSKGANFPSPLWGGVGVGVASGSSPCKNFCAFKLFDPLKSFDPESIWDAEPVWESGFGLMANFNGSNENPAEPLNAIHLGQRLNSLLRALDTIPAQARRLVRWQAKRDQLLKLSKPTRLSPMRPGLPPGWRERRIHEIDDVLRECHGLAHDRLNAPDSG